MAKIFCFSSTGNSLHIAKALAERIGGETLSMSKPVKECKDEVIGFIFPVYFWGLPKIVENFISELQITNKNAYVFAIVCYGGMVYGVQGAVKKLLKEKGVQLAYGKNIKSVENYLPAYKVNNTQELHQSVEQEIELAALDILAKKHSKIEKYTVANKIINIPFPGKKGNCDEGFLVQSNCTACGTCQKICPVNNIVLKEGRPQFLHQCEHCLACMHACPVKAITWKKGMKDDERYRNPYVGMKELISFCGSDQQTQ